MHSSLRLLFLCSFCLLTSLGAESHMPRLFEYQPAPEPIATSFEVLTLDDFTVVGSSPLSSAVAHELERFLNRRGSTVFSERHRVEIVPDSSEFASLTMRDEYLMPIRGPIQSGLDLKLRDTFLIDMPGGGVLKAQFRSGVSIQLDRKTRIILRPSRKKLVSVRWDW